MTPAGTPGDPVVRPSHRGWRAGVGDATDAAMGRPGAWPVALAGLLIRGGLVAFASPIVVLPTMTGLATALGPAIISIALGQPNADVGRLVLLAVTAVAAWLVVSAVLGALTDAVLIGWMADDLEDRPDGPPVRPIAVVRVAIARATAHLPLLLAAGWGAARLVEVTRDELLMPGDLAVPLVLRVVAGAPEVVALLATTWLVGEAVGELAARAVVLEDASAGVGLGRAVGRTIRHLPTVLGTLLLGTAGLVVLVVPPFAAAAVAWAGLRDVLQGDGPVVAAVLAALVLSIAWLGGLALAGLAAAWRSALWTAEALRSGDARPTAGRVPGAAVPVVPPTG